MWSPFLRLPSLSLFFPQYPHTNMLSKNLQIVHSHNFINPQSGFNSCACTTILSVLISFQFLWTFDPCEIKFGVFFPRLHLRVIDAVLVLLHNIEQQVHINKKMHPVLYLSSYMSQNRTLINYYGCKFNLWWYHRILVLWLFHFNFLSMVNWIGWSNK